MSVLRDLLAALPELYDTDPAAVPVLAVTYTGDHCYATVEDDVLTLVPVGGAGQVHTFALDQLRPDPLSGQQKLYTLGQLAADINAVAAEGFAATVQEQNYDAFTDGSGSGPALDDIWRTYPIVWTNQPLAAGTIQGTAGTVGWYLNEAIGDRGPAPRFRQTGLAALGAVVLADTRHDLRTDSPYLAGVTNPVVVLLKPAAARLRELRSYAQGLGREMDLRTADGPWLDRWGALYGLTRYPTERDAAYRQRLTATILQPRCSPTSLVRALTTGLGLRAATITDEYPTRPYRLRAAVTADAAHAGLFGNIVRQVLDLYRPAGVLPDQDATLAPDAEIVPRPAEGWMMQQSYVDTTLQIFRYSETGGWQLTSPRTGAYTRQGWATFEFGGKAFD